MNNHTPSAIAAGPTFSSRKNSKGFTLVEIMVAATIFLLVLGVALPTLVSGMVLALKSSSTNLTTNGVRLATEHMAVHIGSATTISLASPDATGHSSEVDYAVNVGLPGKAVPAGGLSNIPSYSTSLTVNLDGTCHPQAGDRLKIAGLNLGDGLTIATVSDPRSAGTAPLLTDSANVTLTLTTSIAAETVGTATDVIAGQSVSIARPYSYQVTQDADGNNQLVWVSSLGSTLQVIAKGLVSTSGAPFSLPSSGRLSFDFVAENTEDAPNILAGNNRPAYTRVGMHGQFTNKSSDPFQVVAAATVQRPVATLPSVKYTAPSSSAKASTSSFSAADF